MVPAEYEVSMIGNNLNETYKNAVSGSELQIGQLKSGNYTICVTQSEFPTSEQCFFVNVKIPENLKLGKVLVADKKGKLVVSGSKNY